MKIYEETKITHNPLLPTIYFVGDSHTGHYGAVMTHLAGKKKFNLIMHPNGDGLKLLNKDFEEYVQAPLRKYKNNFKKGDIILFSAHIRKYTNNNNFTKQYETFIKQTQNKELKYILFSPTPTFAVNKSGYICQEEWYRPSWVISPLCFAELKKSEWLESHTEQLANIEKFLLVNPKVLYLDTFSLICPDLYCKNYDKQTLMYKDKTHLTSEAAMKLSNIIETFISSK